MAEKKKHTVVIYDKEYNLVSTEHNEHVQEAAVMVDQMLRSIVKSTGATTQRDLYNVAVLAAMQLASRLVVDRIEHRAMEDHFFRLSEFIEREVAEQ